MSSALDDEDLSLSMSTSNTRRGSHRSNEDSRAVGNGSGQPTSTPQPRSEAVQRTAQRLGQYTIVKTLGEGSFGKVKLAVHQVSGQKVALKIISRRKLVTRDMAGRIEREIQYLQLLRHPHIIKLYTVITTATEIIMVLEYAGGELFDYIVQHGRMSEDKARRFFQQIVCAVEYCHRHKIVHRDLKPENLLLDDNLNVKIADFGLSNIMTDGNFLKTSCGSPNYAAPEVISGKLYAGPEVDVWSCGVILYVLLVGRLPFDDEYIPALFKKIAQGNYQVPNYLSSGATRLIRKMLVVNPVHRITIQEIRQDPWFNKDLAPYLQLPTEEFYNTGVDPNKAIDPSNLGPSKPAAVVQKLHDTVVGKLGKTMGYAKDDVQEALAKDEPSAIKDAYLIVRENQIMKENPLLSQESSLQPFLAQSPPAHDSRMPYSPMAAKLPPTSPQSPSPLVDRTRQGSTSSNQNTTDLRSPATTIGILPSSLPDFHRAYMKGHPKPSHPPADQEPSSSIKEQTDEDKAATARRLKPHNRSQLNIDKAANKPEALTPLPPKKSRPTKWQFGIRSRNQPAEAMLAIYKALSAMGAEWEVPTARKPGGDSGSSSRSHSRSRSSSASSRSSRRSHHADDSDADEGHRSRRRHLSIRNGASESDSVQRSYGPHNDWGYTIPEDPWVINARFRKEGMFPPGVAHPSSTHSSRVNLYDEVAARRRSYTAGSGASSQVESAGCAGPGGAGGDASAAGSAAQSVAGDSVEGAGGSGRPFGRYPEPDEAVWVYMTIQLYSIEKEFYLVDFKCAGYERLVRSLVREVKRRGDGNDWRPLRSGVGDSGESDGEEEGVRERDELVGAGRAVGEKRATSPFPFLDVAGRLIIQLADGE